MIKFSAQVVGTEALVQALESLSGKVRKQVAHSLKNVVTEIQQVAVKSIQAHQSQGHRYGKHIASLPGFPPNSNTGQLANSIRWELDEQVLVAAVGTDLPYGLELEVGRKGVEPRPWLRPAVEQVKPTIVASFVLGTKG